MAMNIFNIKRNNEESLRKAYEENFNYVYSFVYSRVAGNKEVTEDIVQDTFLGALQGKEKFRGISSYRTWLCGIAKDFKVFYTNHYFNHNLY